MAISTSARATKPVKTTLNPLLENWWEGPHGGVPPFDRVKVQHFKPALEEAIADCRKGIEGIANHLKTPSFENTIQELERICELQNRVFTIYYTWSGVMADPSYKAVEIEMAPKLAAFRDEFYQNKKLFDRIEAVYNSPSKSKLTKEQQRLVWHYYNEFVLQGAKLGEKQKTEIAQINQKLATLYTQFNQNLLADEENIALILDKKEDLAGLPPANIEAAAAEAVTRKMPGKWVFPNTRSSMEPFLTYSSRRDLREKAFRMWTARGDRKGPTNNNPIITQILKLRQQRSKILGFPTFVHWRLVDSMAQDPQRAMDLMLKVWEPALKQAKVDVANMQKIVEQQGGDFEIQPWDYRYYAEKVRKANYDLDLNEVTPYLQLDNLREAMFFAAGKLFDLKFKRIKGVPVYHEDVSVYKVTRGGKQIGLWYFDPYARAGKRSGAWMSSYREQRRVGTKKYTTIVSNNSNFMKAKKGEPVLVSWTDAVTMFHEFGHALHGLNSDVNYPSLSGTNVPRDYVEFPSQLMEKYLETPEVYKFLKNKDGKPLPKALIAKIEKASKFNQAFEVVEFLASALADMKLHLSTESSIDPAQFEKATMKEIGLPPQIVMRHRLPHFAHLFSGEGYAAGYYSYLWSQVLDSDAFDAFLEAGSPYNKSVAKRYLKFVLSVGNTLDPVEGYRKFRGRDATADALLKDRGFIQ